MCPRGRGVRTRTTREMASHRLSKTFFKDCEGDALQYIKNVF
jgi:hypothetical protein